MEERKTDPESVKVVLNFALNYLRCLELCGETLYAGYIG